MRKNTLSIGFRAVFIGLICLIGFCGGAYASTETVYVVLKDAFPAPSFAVRHESTTPMPVALPVLFRSGHGLFKDQKTSLLNSAIGSFESGSAYPLVR